MFHKYSTYHIIALLLTVVVFSACTTTSTETIKQRQPSADNTQTEYRTYEPATQSALAEDYFNRGMIYYYQEFYDQSVLEFERSLQFDSTAGQLFFLGMCYKFKNRRDVALNMFQQAVRRDSLHKFALLELADYYIGANNVDSTSLVLTRYVGAYGVDKPILLLDVETLYKQFPDETLAAIHKYVSDISSRRTLINAVSVAEDVQDKHLYVSIIQRLVERSPGNARLLEILFRTAFEIEQPELATDFVHQIEYTNEEHQQKLGQLLFDLVVSLPSRDAHVQAIEEMCSHLVALSHHNIRGRAMFMLSDIGNNNLSLHLFQTSKKSYPNTNIYTYGVAEIASRMQRWELSIKAYEEVKTKSSFDNPYLHNAYAYTLACADTLLAEADRYIDLALSVLPQDINFVDTKAWVSFRQGNLSEALSLIEQCLDSPNATAEMWAHAAEIHASIGNEAKSIQCIEHAISLQPENTQLRQLYYSIKHSFIQ